jgi:hypothetical protein
MKRPSAAAIVSVASAAAGCRIEERSQPAVGHSLHGQDPARFATILSEWAASLPAAAC